MVKSIDRGFSNDSSKYYEILLFGPSAALLQVLLGTRSFHLDDSDDADTLPPNASETRVLISNDEHTPRYMAASPCKCHFLSIHLPLIYVVIAFVRATNH